jgi:osmotically-inducible protein OsmY
MKKTNLAIIAFTVIGSMNTVQAAQTKTNTTESYSYTKEDDGSITSSKKLVISERQTDKQILKALDDKIDGFKDLDDDVSFTVQDGIVILKGSVENSSEKDHARLLAESVAGVTRVDNLINIE